MKSNALDMSVKRAPKLLLLSKDSLKFSNMTRRQCWPLHPVLKPHRVGNSMPSKYS